MAGPLPRVLRLCVLLLAGAAPLAEASSAAALSGSAAGNQASAAGKARGAARRFWPFDSTSTGLMAVEGTETVQAPIDGAMYDEALPEPVPAQRPRPRQLRSRKPKAASRPAVPGQGGLVVPDQPLTEPLAPRTEDVLVADPSAPNPTKVVAEYDDDLPAEGDNKQQALPSHPLRRQPVRSRRASALASTQHSVSSGSKGPGQWDKCLKFASWVKSQSLQGPEVAQVWLNTCQPTVMSGSATKQYITMCESLGGAVQEFANNEEWTPKQACTSVLRAFRESGVGSTPLSP